MQPATSNRSRRSASGAWQAMNGAAGQSSFTGMPCRRGDVEQVRAGERLAAADRDVEHPRAGERVQTRQPFRERQVVVGRPRRAVLVAVGAGQVAAPREREVRLLRRLEGFARRLFPERRRRNAEVLRELLVDVRQEWRLVERHDRAEALVPPPRRHASPVRRLNRWARTAAVNDRTAPDATRLQRNTTTVVPTLDEFGLKPSFSLRMRPRSGRSDAAASASPAVPMSGRSARSCSTSSVLIPPLPRGSFGIRGGAFQAQSFESRNGKSAKACTTLVATASAASAPSAAAMPTSHRRPRSPAVKPSATSSPVTPGSSTRRAAARVPTGDASSMWTRTYSAAAPARAASSTVPRTKTAAARIVVLARWRHGFV